MKIFEKMLSDKTRCIDTNYVLIDKSVSYELNPFNFYCKSGSRYYDWLSINGEYYHYKEFNLNDFIGVELCKKIGINSCNYELIKIDGNIYTISKSFKEKGILYSNSRLLNNNIYSITNEHVSIYSFNGLIRELKRLNYDENIINLLIHDIIKMSILDYYSRETDRVSNNYLFELKDKNIKLSPLFDFGESFGFHKGFYEKHGIDCIYSTNDYINFSCNSYEYNKYAHEYNYLIEYTKLLRSINLMEIINNICKKYNLILYKELEDIYKYEESMSKKRLNIRLENYYREKEKVK